MAAFFSRLARQLRAHARALHRLGLAAGVVAVAIGAANVAGALATSAELEVREGSLWLHVLAQHAGVSLYDHGQVAFVNMNHGPLDPWLKFALYSIAPFLPAQAVLRFFVPLLPMAMVFLFSRAGRGLMPGLLVGGSMYLVLLGMWPGQFLIGRSDPTALVLLCGLLLLAERIRAWASPAAGPTGAPRTWRPGATGLAFGAIAVSTLMTNWRFAPVVGGVAIAALADWVSGSRNTRGSATVVAAAGAAVGGLVVAAAVWIGLFGGDLALYYRHVFGLFTKESGWGTLGQMPFFLVAWEVTDGRGLFSLVLFVSWAGAVAAEWRRGHRLAAATAFVGTGLALLATCVGFARNHGAGGVHYFAPLYVWMAAYALARVRWDQVSAPLRLALALGLVAGLPFAELAAQARELAQLAARARTPYAELRQLAREHAIYSEDLHLFRERYAGQVVDVGDTAAAVARTGYLGVPFSETFRRHHADLAAQPPPYVVVGALSIVSPQLLDLLRRDYVLVRETPFLIGLNPGLPIQLYQHRAIRPAGAAAHRAR